MNQDEAIRILREHEGDIRAHGLASLALFGSTARGDAEADSDIDVIVSIESGRKFSQIDLSGLRLFLCDVFGRETDVVIREDLRAKLRERISVDELRVF